MIEFVFIFLSAVFIAYNVYDWVQKHKRKI